MTYKDQLGLVPVNVKDTKNKVNIKPSYLNMDTQTNIKLVKLKILDYCYALNKLFLGFEGLCVCYIKICCNSISPSCRFVLHAKKTAFVVEHDFIMATYLADRVVVFEGQPSICTKANT